MAATNAAERVAACKRLSSSNNHVEEKASIVQAHFTKPTSTQDDRLVELLHTKLPRELFDQIRETTLELAICPGHAFPQQATSGDVTYDWNGKSYVVARPELLRLSKVVYGHFQKKFWSDNVFVIGTGPPSRTIAWLDKISSAVAQQIRKVHLALTIRDLGEGWSDRFLESFPVPKDGKPLSTDRPQDATWKHLYLGSRDGALELWAKKLLGFRLLALTELTLDLTECFDWKVIWLGRVAGEMRRFRHGVPPKLRVIGPNNMKDDCYTNYLVLPRIRGK